MSAEPGSVTRYADQFVPIAQITERSCPKRQVAGENPAGDTSIKRRKPTLAGHGMSCPRTTECAPCLEREFKLTLQLHTPEDLVQALVTNHFVVLTVGAATGFGVEMFDAGIGFRQRLAAKEAAAALEI